SRRGKNGIRAGETERRGREPRDDHECEVEARRQDPFARFHESEALQRGCRHARLERMRKVVAALLLFSCGTNDGGPDASATNDAGADVAAETTASDAGGDASDATATLGLPRVYVGASDGSIH